MKSEKAQRFLKERESRSMMSLIYENSKVRIVNKTEICRLQGFPDRWCDILTDVEAGSLLGDGWTLPIIEHIFSYIIKEKNEKQRDG